jgi:hypothetical protein
MLRQMAVKVLVRRLEGERAWLLRIALGQRRPTLSQSLWAAFYERITLRLTLAGDLGKRRSAQRLALDI